MRTISRAQWSRLFTTLLGFCAIYFGADAVVGVLFRPVRGLPGGAELVKNQLDAIHGTILVFACLLAGIARFQRSHPVFRPAYLSWLQITPWVARLPLPLG